MLTMNKIIVDSNILLTIHIYKMLVYHIEKHSKARVVPSSVKVNPISPGVLGPGNTQFKASKLLFDFETLCVLL